MRDRRGKHAACATISHGELDPKKRYAIWERVQAVFYADAARIKFGDYFRLDARRKEVHGYEAGPYMHFWNVWLEKR